MDAAPEDVHLHDSAGALPFPPYPAQPGPLGPPATEDDDEWGDEAARGAYLPSTDYAQRHVPFLDEDPPPPLPPPVPTAVVPAAVVPAAVIPAAVVPATPAAACSPSSVRSAAPMPSPAATPRPTTRSAALERARAAKRADGPTSSTIISPLKAAGSPPSPKAPAAAAPWVPAPCALAANEPREDAPSEDAPREDAPSGPPAALESLPSLPRRQAGPSRRRTPSKVGRAQRPPAEQEEMEEVEAEEDLRAEDRLSGGSVGTDGDAGAGGADLQASLEPSPPLVMPAPPPPPVPVQRRGAEGSTKSLAEQLNEAIAERSQRTISLPTRLRPPPTRFLDDQLGEAIAERSRRQPSADVDEADACLSCTFCGVEGKSRSGVVCESCHSFYHLRCLSKSQAARFKGRRWTCDSCLHAAAMNSMRPDDSTTADDSLRI